MTEAQPPTDSREADRPEPTSPPVDSRGGDQE